MFDKQKKDQDFDVTEPELNSAEKKHVKDVKFTVHAMPKKFHSAHGGSSKSQFDKPKKKESSISKVVIFSVVGIVVVGLGVVGFLLFRNKAGDADTVANANGNINTTVTINLNRNSNANGNSNTNANTNINANANSNSNTNTTTNATSNTNTATNTAVTFANAKSSEDLDDDELTDVEEDIYTTERAAADTDGDGFADGQELLFGYSPLDRGKLEDATIVLTYTNPTYGFSFLYPNSWVIDQRGTDGRGVVLISPDGEEYFEISIQDNLGRKTATEWYLEIAPQGTQSSSLATTQNWAKTATGVVSVDGYSTFFGSGNNIYTIYYETNRKTELDFKSTYQIVTKSMKFSTPSVVNINSATNTNSNSNTNSNTNTNTNSNSNTNSNTNTNTNSNTNAS